MVYHYISMKITMLIGWTIPERNGTFSMAPTQLEDNANVVA